MLNKVLAALGQSTKVSAIAESSDAYYIGGTFSYLEQKVDEFYYGGIINSTTAAIIKNLDFNGEVKCAAIYGNNIYFGGNFTGCSDYVRQYIVKINLTTGTVDADFDTESGFDNVVNTIAVDSSGNVYVGGTFTYYKGTARQRIAKLNGTTGALDATFNSASGFNGNINSIALDSSGNVYVGMNNSVGTYKGTTRQGIAKLNGSTAALDATFDTSTSGFDSTVYSVALDSSGNVYVGGAFTAYKGTTRQRIAKLNGSTAALITAFDATSGFSGAVNRIAIDSSGNVYAGGNFTTYKGTNRAYIAKLNGTTAALDNTFDSSTGFNGQVYSIAFDDSGNVYVAGQFTTYKGTARQRIAKLNGSTAALDATFDTSSGCGAQATSVAVDSSGNVYVGGQFTDYKGAAPRSTRIKIAKILKSTGLIDTAFDPGSGFTSGITTPIVNAIAVDSSGNVYVGGAFSAYNGTSCTNIAKLNGAGALDATFSGALGSDVYSLVLDSSGNNIYVGGVFSTAKGVNRPGIAKLSCTTGALDATFNPTVGGTINSIALDSSGNVYIGGYITKSAVNVNIAKLNGTTGAAIAGFDAGSGFNNYVSSIALDSSGNVYVGGNFTTYKGAGALYIAKLNGSTGAVNATFDTVTTGFGSTVNSIALDGAGNVYAGGSFSAYKGATRQRIAKLNGSTAAVDTTFDTVSGVTDGTLSVIKIDSSGNLHVGGQFDKYKTMNRGNFATLDTSKGQLVKAVAVANTAPTDIAISASTIAENAGVNAVVGTFSATDAEGGAITYSLVAGSGDTHNSLFNVSGSSLRANASFDYENMPAGATGKTLSVRVQATDSGSLSYSKALTITVTNVNEAPSGITLSASTIAENNAINAVIGALSAIDPDTGDALTLSIQSGADKFQIISGNLCANVVFDYETAASHSVTVRATDAGGLYKDQAFTITVTNVNEAPSSISLSASSITENNAINAVIGTISAVDPDGTTPTLSLQGTDASAFNINGNQLRASQVFDYETKSSYSITIRATDAGGLYKDQAFTITIVNDPSDDITTLTLPANQLIVQGKVCVRTANDPTVTPIKLSSGADLPDGSIVVCTSQGNKKFFKIPGSSTSYMEIYSSVPAEWEWAQAGIDAWNILKTFI